jgi:ABC-type molybdate transport system permease subunit
MNFASYTHGKGLGGDLLSAVRCRWPTRAFFAGIVLSFAPAHGEYVATHDARRNIPGKTQTMLWQYNKTLVGLGKQAAQIPVADLTALITDGGFT